MHLSRILLAGALAVGCSSTRLTSDWAAPEAGRRPYRHLLVVGLSPDPGARAVFEDAFVERLESRGVRALRSVQVLPEHGRLEREVVAAWVREREIDGVLVTHVSRVDKETRYVPPAHGTTSMYGYYAMRWPVVASPGYVTEDTIVVLETNLYDARSGAVVWSGVSETFNPGDRNRVVGEVSEVLTDALADRGLIALRTGARGPSR